MGVNIKDVALRAGVSVGTVSNVLNNPDRVRPGTRERVQRVIDDLGFVPSSTARQLVAGRSNTLAYLSFDLRNPFFTDVARGAEDVAREHGLGLFVCSSAHDRDREDDYLEQLTELRVRGVLVTPIDQHNPRLQKLRDNGVPVVLVDRPPQTVPDDWCAVGVDDVRGGEMAVQHLLDGGHRRLAFAGGSDLVPQVADRFAGASGALAGAEIMRFDTEALTVDDGRRVGERLLGTRRADRPTAVFCANDLVAVGLLQHLTQQGMRVPDDVAIVGYDDIEWAAAAAVPLSSVAQPRHLLGRTAAELLLEEADVPGRHVHQQILFQPELVARASTRTPA